MNKKTFLLEFRNIFPGNITNIAIWAIALCTLYVTMFFSFDLFHSVAEIFSITIAVGIFMIAWNAQDFFENHFLFFISIGYLFVAVLDLGHALSFKGMGVFGSFNSTYNLSTQFWIAARYMQAITLLIAPIYIHKKINIKKTFLIYVLIVLGIFVLLYLKIFPIAYIDGVGLTLFKKISEYLISAILVVAGILLWEKKSHLSKHILYLIIFSIILTIISEISFTLYFNQYDFSNVFGHFLKIFAFYMVYKAIIEISLRKPFTYVFKNLADTTENLKIFKLAFDNAFAHIVITDENARVLYANKSAEEITGFSQEEIIGNTPALWGGQMPANFYQDFWKTIKKNKSKFTGEITNKRKNGEIYEAEIRVSSVLDDNGEVKFFVGLEKDITEEKRVEKSKTEFLSLAAHQLRTPLANISLTSEMLSRGIFGDLSDEGKVYLENISSEIKDMAEMITTFLDVSKIEMKKFPIELKPLKLYDVLEKTTAKILPQINEKKLNFIKNYNSDLPIIDLDKEVMNILIGNILSNSVKYTHPSGEIKIGIEKKQNGILIKISDTGIGIPEDQKAYIFTKMFRAKNANSIKSEGSGLGLYLVKSLASQSGYTLSFESKENEGTTFYLFIPNNTN